MSFEFAGVTDIYDAIHVSVLNPGFLVLIIFIIGLMLVGMPLYSHILKIRDSLSEKNDKLNTLTVLFSQLNDGSCGWVDGSNEIFFTEKFAKSLLLDPAAPISLVDIKKQLDLTSSSQLSECIYEIRENEQPFSMVGMAGNKKLYITGRINKLNDNRIFQLNIEEEGQEITSKLERENKIYQNKIARMQDVLDKAPIAIWQRSSEGQIIDCNTTYGKIVEHKKEQVKAAHIELLDTKRSNSPRIMAVNAARLNQEQRSRFALIVEGQRKHFEVVECPPSKAGRQYGYGIDVSELEALRLELQRHKLAHKVILEHLSSPIAYFNKDTRLELFNEAYTKIFELDTSWLYTKPTMGEIIDQLRKNRRLPEYIDYREFKKQRSEFFRTLIEPHEELIHMPDGKTLRLMIAPHPSGGLLYVFNDITDKLNLERDYKTLLAVQRQTLDRLYEGITVFGSDNRMRLSNPAAASIWNIPEQQRQPDMHLNELLDLIKPQFEELQEWENLSERLTQLFDARDEKAGQFILNNKQQVIQFSYTPLPDGSHMVTFVDISEVWQMQQALQERNQALEQADRLKSSFLANISYELRSPLNTVLGFTDILMNKYFGDLSERQLDYCKGINEASERLMSLINDILDLANIEAGTLTLRLKQINVQGFLKRMINLVHTRASDRGVIVECVNRANTENFEADESRLKQAVFNLLTNAIKYTPAGSKVILAADVSIESGHSEFILEVRYGGAGGVASDHDSIFQLFDSNNLANTGDGVGLPLVKSLIELHEGTLQLYSDEGPGVVVRCSIPLNDKAPEATEIKGAA